MSMDKKQNAFAKNVFSGSVEQQTCFFDRMNPALAYTKI